ncbi:reverse transcriptase domain-containing protein [Pseudomonas sp. LS2P72]
MTDWVLSISSRNARLSVAWSNVSKFIRTKFWWCSGLIRIPGSTPARRRLAQAPERKVCKIVRGVISPLLANIYLHYVLDLWTRQWRQRHARGDVIVVRYADDSVVGFRAQWQAQQFLVQLQERLARFGLSLNASKTRLIEFGRFAARNRRKRGLGKPETFDFLGFTHCCSTNRSGGFQILRLTVKKRMRATLLAIRDELKRRRHESVQVVGQWLTRVVTGYFNYHSVPGNLIRLGGFRLAVCRLWRQALKRRSQRNRLQWSRYGRLVDLYMPRPRNAHPYPEDRFASRTQGRSRMR